MNIFVFNYFIVDYFVIKSGEKEVSVFRGESLQNYFQRMADCDG